MPTLVELLNNKPKVIPSSSRLPRHPTDQVEVLDRYGNRWQFDANMDTWISKGVVKSIPVVSEANDGLITPEIYNSIQRLKTLVDSGFDVTPLKLLPGLDAYWYYWRSSDKLFRFIPEGEDTLRIEVDRGRFYQLLFKNRCVGPTGQQGAKGKTGVAGTPGPNELCYAPNIDGNKLEFAIYTPTPLLRDGPISLPNNHVPDISVRLFKSDAPIVVKKLDQLQFLASYYHANTFVTPQLSHTRALYAKRSVGELNKQAVCGIPLSHIATLAAGTTLATFPSVTILIDPTGSVGVRVISSDYDIDQDRTLSAIDYNSDTGIVCGKIYLASGTWDGDWCVKSRQCGPDGKDGDAGECRIKLVGCSVDNSNVIATRPLMNVRLDCDKRVIQTTHADLDEIGVDKIVLVNNSAALATSTTTKSVFAAAQMTLDDYKSVNQFSVALPDYDVPELELAHWSPQPGCRTRRHYSNYKFQWVPTTDIGACKPNATWYGPTGDGREAKYPFPFKMAAPPPADKCCSTPGFFCPNIQSGACPDDQPTPPPPP